MIKAVLLAIALITFTLSPQTIIKNSFGFNSTEIPKSLDKTISDQYIVVYKDSVTNSSSVSEELEKTLNLVTKFRFNNTIKGYSAEISKAKLDKIKKDPRVAFVTQDREVAISAPLIPLIQQLSSPTLPSSLPTVRINPRSTNTPIPTQTLTPTNSSTPQPTFNLNKQTIPNSVHRIGLTATNEGSGIGIAILDTGIDLNHNDLSINVVADTSCIAGKTSGDDDHGHGTHLAGTIGALNNSEGVIGVAPQAKLISVKVLDSKGIGSLSSLICGIDWITENAKKYNIKIANLSLGAAGQNDNDCGKTNGDALHLAICKSRNAGITHIAAAGNDGSNVYSTIPAAYEDAVITVSALNDSDGEQSGYGPNTWDGQDDTFASFSNFGDIIDLAAPGVDILSTKRDGGYANLSGTSMAAAHVSGAAALYLKINPEAEWTKIREGLITIGEPLRSGHTDPTRLHLEKVVRVNSL